jgi:hypothetical protein
MRVWIACLGLLLACCRDVAASNPEVAVASTFEIDGDRFLLDGKPWQIISGRWSPACARLQQSSACVCQQP